jgi:hypothetical protein
MHTLLVIALAVLYPAVHILNGWLFDFATLSDHVSLIYLPAFLRLFNLLVMGPLLGTFTTVLGGILLMAKFDEPIVIASLNIICSCAGPLLALYGFRFFYGRNVVLTSLRDLSILTLTYCLLNSLLHNLLWFFTNPEQIFDYVQAFWMFTGDLLGALFGAYLMKALIDYMEHKGFNFSSSSQPKN